MKLIKNLCFFMTFSFLIVSCKTAEFNTLTQRVEALEKENKDLKTNLATQSAVAKEMETKATVALEQLQQHSQVAGEQAAEAQRFQIEAARAQKLYDECAKKKDN